MHNVFNYLSVRRAAGVRAATLIAALDRGDWLKTRFNNPQSDLIGLAWRRELEHTTTEFIPHDLVATGTLTVVEEAVEEDAAEAYEHLWMLDFDSSLAQPRMGRLRVCTGVDNWTLVYLAGEEQFETEDEAEPAATRFLHGGWFAFADAPEGCYVACMVTDPFLFADGNRLVTARPNDAYAHLVGGTETLTRVFLQTCGVVTTDLPVVHTVVGYCGRDSYINRDVQSMAYNASYLQNGASYAMGPRPVQSHGVTVARAYRSLRGEWPLLTNSSPDLYTPTPMLLGFRFEFDLETWEPVLLDAFDSLLETARAADPESSDDDAAQTAEFESDLDDVLSTIEDTFDLGPHIVLGLDVPSVEALRGLAVNETDGSDASKWFFTTALQPLLGCNYAGLHRLATEVLTTDILAAINAVAPEWYRDSRYNHVIPAHATPMVVSVAFETGLPLYLVLDPRVIPPYIGLGVLPYILGAPEAVDDFGLILLGDAA